MAPVARRRLAERALDPLRDRLACYGRIDEGGQGTAPIHCGGRPAPLIDIGTLDAIRDGRIKLRGEVASFGEESVVFKQSPAERFDAIILATGFRPDLRALLPDAKGVLNATGAPLVSGRATAEPGLFFCGAIPSALGQFRQIGIEAIRIAAAAA